MTRVLRVVPVIAICALVIGASAPRASAALWLRLTPEKAKPGTEVTARTFGDGGLGSSAGSSFPMFLEESPPIPIGRMVVDQDGNGTLRFTVPDVAPGEYAVMIHCPPCAAGSMGAENLVIGYFTVLGRARTAPLYTVSPDDAASKEPASFGAGSADGTGSSEPVESRWIVLVAVVGAVAATAIVLVAVIRARASHKQA